MSRHLEAIRRTVEADSFLMQMFLTMQEEGLEQDKALECVYNQYVLRYPRYAEFYRAAIIHLIVNPEGDKS